MATVAGASVVGRKVKVLADQKKVKSLCDSTPSLAEWSDKRAGCCGKPATIADEDDDDWTIQLEFEDGFESWFPRLAVTDMNGKPLPVKEEEKQAVATSTKTFTLKRMPRGDGRWESIGVVTGVAGKPWQLIDSVTPGSPAERAGLKKGMTMQAINGEALATAGWDRFKAALDKAGAMVQIAAYVPAGVDAGTSSGFGPPSGPPPPGAAQGPSPPTVGPSLPQSAGPSLPTTEDLFEVAKRNAAEQARKEREQAELDAKRRSKAASISALAGALMRRFGGMGGRLYLEGLRSLCDVIGNPVVSRHEYRQCCLAMKCDSRRGLGIDFIAELLIDLPETEEKELHDVASENQLSEGPTWEPPPVTEAASRRMAEDRKRWQGDCPRCGNPVGGTDCPRGLWSCTVPPRAVVIGDSHARELSEVLANFVSSSGNYAFRVDAAPIVGASAQGLINPNSRTLARQKYIEAISSRGRDGSAHIDYLFVMIGSVDFDSVMFHKRDKRDGAWWYPQQIKASANAVEKFLLRDVDYGRVGKVVLVAIHPPPVERQDFFEQLNKTNHRNDEKEAGDRLGRFHAETLPDLAERTVQANNFNQELQRIVKEVNKTSATAGETESRAVLLTVWDQVMDKTSMTVAKEYRRSVRTDTHLKFDALHEHYAAAIRKTLAMDCVTPAHYQASQGQVLEMPEESIETHGELARPDSVRVVTGPKGPPPQPGGGGYLPGAWGAPPLEGGSWEPQQQAWEPPSEPPPGPPPGSPPPETSAGSLPPPPPPPLPAGATPPPPPPPLSDEPAAKRPRTEAVPKAPPPVPGKKPRSQLADELD